MKLTQFLMEDFFPVNVKREGNAFYIANEAIETLSEHEKFTRAETAHMLELLRLMNIEIYGSNMAKEIELPSDEEFMTMFENFNRNEIIMKAIPLVAFAAKGLSTKYDIPIDEICSYGYEALINCIDEFYASQAYKRNISFSVVALLTVFQANMCGIISEKIPMVDNEGINPINMFKAIDRVALDFGGFVIPAEVLNDADIIIAGNNSLLNMVGIHSPTSFYDLSHVAMSHDFDEDIHEKVLHQKLVNAFSSLTPEKKASIRKSFFKNDDSLNECLSKTLLELSSKLK